MEKNKGTLRALELIRKVPKKPHWPAQYSLTYPDLFTKVPQNVIDYFKFINNPIPLNEDGKIHIHAYQSMLDTEGIKRCKPIIYRVLENQK